MSTIVSSPDGTALRAKRERLGVSRWELAAQLGCGLTALANIEANAVGESAIRSRAFAALAEREAEVRAGT